jgi:hypothetical protein
MGRDRRVDAGGRFSEMSRAADAIDGWYQAAEKKS